MNVNGKLSQSSSLTVAFTESPMFIRPTASDDSAGSIPSEDFDGVLTIPAPLESGLWTSPRERLRGGFRFLTIALHDTTDPYSSVTISNVSCAVTFSPHVEDLRDYSGYFYAKDPVFKDEDFLTKIWYAGAYTLQMNSIAADEGRDTTLTSGNSFSFFVTLTVRTK